VRFLLDNDVPDTIARVLSEARHDVLLLRLVMSKKSSDSAVFDYAVANELILITCNRDDFIPLANARTHQGLIVSIRRRTRIAECANLLRLLDTATESGLTANINFA
jgi:predicted nuclease of predicted toxin-antitoxin system